MSRGAASSAGSATGSAAAATDGFDPDTLRGEVVAWPLLTFGSAGPFETLAVAFGFVFEVAADWGGASSGLPKWRRTISFAVIGRGDFVALAPAVELAFDLLALADVPLLVLPPVVELPGL